jgi:mannan endo-1,6-alpha-mannosidase
VGQQMAALEVIQSNLIVSAPAPLTGSTGGTSQGNPSAGTTTGSTDPTALLPPSTSEKVGAGFFTALIVVIVGGALAWLSLPDRLSR